MRHAIVLSLVLGVVMSPGALDAQTPPRGERERVEAGQQRRAQLERQIRERFMAQAAERLQLDTRQRQRLDDVLRAGAESRRELAQESRQIRARLMRSVGAEGMTDAAYEQMLDEMAALREREHALERSEAAELAAFLDARQRAHFMVLRMQLNERVRGMRSGPPGQRSGERGRPPG